MADDSVKEENKDVVKEEKPAVDAEKNDDAEEPQEAEEEEERIYQDQLSNRVVVARNHPLSYYVDRARRILRMENGLRVSGRGNTISMACTLVEVLKRQKIANIESISTCMNVEPYFTASGDPRWSLPTSMITFHLTRGEFAEYISDYHQRKIIEIFENTDTKQTGTLSFDDVESLNFSGRFRAQEDQCRKAKEFLSEQSEQKLDLPTFIKYASLLIHPLLRDKVFKEILTKEFGIAAAAQSQQTATAATAANET